MRRHPRAAFAVVMLCSFFALAGSAFGAYVNSGTFASEGSGDGQLAKFPGRAALEQSTGNLFVVDPANNRVEVFEPNGSGSADYLTQFGAAQLSSPWGIAIDENGGQTSVYVADAGNDRIVKYASDEAATPSFSVDGTFTSPGKGAAAGQIGNFKAALAIDPTTHDLLVADGGNNRVARFQSDGTPVSSFDGSAGAGSPGAFTGLLDLAVNSAGDVYVIDQQGNIVNQTGTSRALRYSSGGSYKATLTPVGPNNRPATVAVRPSNDDVVVSGQQDAVWRDESPTVHLFDSANNALPSPPVNDQYGSISGLAFSSASPGAIYVVLYPGLYQGSPWAGTPQVQRFKEVGPPLATITPASNVAELSATLNGTVNPEGGPTTCRFQYSTDMSFNKSVPCAVDPGSGTSPVAVSADLTNLAPDATYNFRLVASGYGGQTTATSTGLSFTTLHVDLPALTIDPPTGVTAESVDVSGTVDPQGFATTARFEYSSDGGSTWTQGPVHNSSTDPGLASSTSPVAISDEFTGLSPSTNYLVRISASNPAGPRTSANASFRTSPTPPLAQTLAAAQVSGSSAALKAIVDPQGEKTTYYFEYGRTTAYGSVSPAVPASVGSGNQFISVGELVYDLGPQVTYHFRVVATNPTGTTFGADRSFTTVDQRSCPNEEFRRGGAASLPDCRAYELVSPQENAGNKFGDMRVPLTGFDGNDIFWGTGGPVPDTGSVNGNGNEFYSTRTPNGWVTRAVTPEADPTKPPEIAGVALAVWRAEDLSGVILAGGEGAVMPGAPVGTYASLFLRRKDSAGLTWITKPTIASPTGKVKFSVGGASTDLSRIAFTANAQNSEPVRLVPEDEDRLSGSGVYDYVNGELRAVSILPDGSIPPRGAEMPASNPYQGATGLRNQVSRDGRRIVFIADPAGGNNKHVYMRIDDEDGLRTIPVSRNSAGESVPGTFQFASPDGSKVWFKSVSSLLPGAPASSIYELDVESGSITYVPDVRAIVGASRDGSRYAFIQESTWDLWVSDNGALHRAGGLSFWDAFIIFSLQVQVTPDGSRWLYGTGGEIDSGAFNNTGGFTQFYLYDLEEDRLTCVSCPRSGIAPNGDAVTNNSKPELAPRYGRALTDDGRRVFFDTPAPLDDRDVNGVRDVYEWTDEGVFLLSGGTDEQPSFFADSSSSGDDVFIMTVNKLTAFDRDDEKDIYDVRVGGGFRPPPLPDPCDLDCQGAPSNPPADVVVGSADYQGSGVATTGRCSVLEERFAKARQRVRTADGKAAKAKARKRVRQVKRQVAQCRTGSNRAARSSKGGNR